MKFKPNYVVIPLITLVVAIMGSVFTGMGMPWYDTKLVQPMLTPPRWVFPVVWNTIFVMTTISAIIIWNKEERHKWLRWLLSFGKKKKDLLHQWIIGLFIANAVLNVLWSYVFFVLHNIRAAFAEMILLEATVIALIVLCWKESRTASILLLPYVLWVGFATYLTFLVVQLN